MPFAFKTDIPRKWGTRFDSLAPSSSPPSEAASSAASTPTESSDKSNPVEPLHLGKDYSKDSQDASIFVGSLPADIDQYELIDALSARISQFAVIRNIKIVRDFRGGVCAFVHCEDEAAAESLVEKLRSTRDEPLFGRFPRYEKARSLRSLLISYRAPTILVPVAAINADVENPASSVSLPIDPATAMQIFRSAGTRFHSLRYNEQVRASDGPTGDLLLSPLRFDAQSITKIVSYFGPTEAIRPHNTDAGLTPPHDAVRSPGMDATVWEVQFCRRNDALNALMTLRTVPHLTITWAHRNNDGKGQKQNYAPIISSDISSPKAAFGTALAPSLSTEPGTSLMVDQSTSLVESEAAVLAPKWTSLTDGDFPPLTGKQGSWADEVATHDDSVLSCNTDFSSEYAGDVPLTPGFTTSPTTPKTFSSFPRTPRDNNFDMMLPEERVESELDPLSLFVGGFPAYWEEANIRGLFQRYGGLMSAKVIKPTFKKGTAFAFVQFDNPDSAQQAIQEEHGCVYDQLTIRVQLRDLKPPSKYGPRRRYRYQNGLPNHRGELLVDADCVEKRGSDHDLIEFVDPAPLCIRVPSPAPGRAIALPATPVEMQYPTIESRATPVSKNPPPSPTKALAVAPLPTVAPYSVPYYPPAPWMTGYPPPYGYHIPYPPGYPPFALTHPYMQHPAPLSYPIASDPAQQQHVSQQAPLQPTGFIQGDQGTLVPVYQAEALERYMTGARRDPASAAVASPVDKSTPIPTTPAAISPLQYSQPPLQWAAPPQAVFGWGHQNQVVPGYPYAHPAPSLSSNAPVSSTHRTPLFPVVHGVAQQSGKRQRDHRQQDHNYGFNRANSRRVQHPGQGHDNHGHGFEGVYAPQMPWQAQQHTHDWTMWAGSH